MPFSPRTIRLSEIGGVRSHLWRLTEPLTYTSAEGASYTVPTPTRTGFVTDLASVPRVLTWLVPRYGLYTKSAIVHDYLCHLDKLSRFKADEVFGTSMKESKVPRLRRQLMVAAVTWPTMSGYLFMKHLWLTVGAFLALGTGLFFLDLPGRVGPWGWLLNILSVMLLIPVLSLGVTERMWWKQILLCMFYSVLPGLAFVAVAVPLSVVLGLFMLVEDPRSLQKLFRYLAKPFIVRKRAKARAKMAKRRGETGASRRGELDAEPQPSGARPPDAPRAEPQAAEAPPPPRSQPAEAPPPPAPRAEPPPVGAEEAGAPEPGAPEAELEGATPREERLSAMLDA